MLLNIIIAERLSTRQIIATCGLWSRLEFLGMYVCMYVYVRISGVTRVCAFVHVCMYVCKYDVRTYVYAYEYVLHVLGQPWVWWELHTLTYTHTMLLHFVLLLIQCHRYSGARPHVCTYAHMFYLGLHVLHELGQPWELRGLTYAQNNVAAHCATVAQCHRYSCAMARSAQNC